LCFIVRPLFLSVLLFAILLLFPCLFVPFYIPSFVLPAVYLRLRFRTAGCVNPTGRTHAYWPSIEFLSLLCLVYVVIDPAPLDVAVDLDPALHAFVLPCFSVCPSCSEFSFGCRLARPAAISCLTRRQSPPLCVLAHRIQPRSRFCFATRLFDSHDIPPKSRRCGNLAIAVVVAIYRESSRQYPAHHGRCDCVCKRSRYMCRSSSVCDLSFAACCFTTSCP